MSRASDRRRLRGTLRATLGRRSEKPTLERGLGGEGRFWPPPRTYWETRQRQGVRAVAVGVVVGRNPLT